MPLADAPPGAEKGGAGEKGVAGVPARRDDAKAGTEARPTTAAGPAVSAEALAPWLAKLRQRVIEGGKAGQKPNALLWLVRGKSSSVRILSSDDTELLVELEGGKMPVAWSRLDVRKDMLGLARAFATKEEAEDYILKGVFLQANGLSADADDAFSKALQLKPAGGAEGLEAIRRALGK
jgi:hypothetical protein